MSYTGSYVLMYGGPFACFGIDVDECTAGTSGCMEHCQNTRGSFYCVCPKGYFLQSDGVSCKGQCSVTIAYLKV